MPRYETYLVDEASGASIVAAFNLIGNDVMIDYEHGNEMATGPDDGGRAAGWIKGVDVVDGEGIYADPVSWTPRATQLLRDREYRYRSPHFTYDQKTMRIIALLDDSLVNKPASVGMIPMAAKASDTPAADGGDNSNPDNKRSTQMSEAILKALEVEDEGEAIAAVVKMKAAAETNTKDITDAREAAAKATAALETSDALIDSVMEAVECESRDALVGACKAHKDTAAKVVEVQAKLDEIEQVAAATKKAALIDGANVGEDTRAWLEGQPLSTVESYVENCCKVPEVHTGEPQSRSAKSDSDPAPEDWFKDYHRGKGDEEIAAQWKAHCAWAKTHPMKFATDNDGAE
jgi:phage I-like protein